jgi:hypothetical protein
MEIRNNMTGCTMTPITQRVLLKDVGCYMRLGWTPVEDAPNDTIIVAWLCDCRPVLPVIPAPAVEGNIADPDRDELTPSPLAALADKERRSRKLADPAMPLLQIEMLENGSYAETITSMAAVASSNIHPGSKMTRSRSRCATCLLSMRAS